jgi:hypothetical protein
MTTPTYNLLAVRKTIGAIHHRLAEINLHPMVRRRIIVRQIQDLQDTLPAKFEGIIIRIMNAHCENDTLELVAGLALIESMLPPLTYGCVLQGQVFEVADRGMYRKNKAGRVELLTGTILPHFPADMAVKLVNE